MYMKFYGVISFSMLSLLNRRFHYGAFFARSDFQLLKLNRFLISSSRELTRQKKKSLRAKKVTLWKTCLRKAFSASQYLISFSMYTSF